MIANGGSTRDQRWLEVFLVFGLMTQLQWFFGNVYEEILAPNSIVASIGEIDAYNRFLRITEPYYYYVPLTQLGVFVVVVLAIWRGTPRVVRILLRKAAVFGVLAFALTGYIVTQYNLRMFFGNVDALGDQIHRRYLEWALWNLLRIALVAVEAGFIFAAYRRFLIGKGHRASSERRRPVTWSA